MARHPQTSRTPRANPHRPPRARLAPVDTFVPRRPVGGPLDEYEAGGHLGEPLRRPADRWQGDAPFGSPPDFLGRPNPPPAAWGALPPSTPYPCKSAYVGKVVPGKRGGQITSCATPTRRHPKEGQLAINTPHGKQTFLRRTVVKTRLRDQGKRPCDQQRDLATSAMDLGQWLQARRQGLRDGTWIPMPPDYEFPHRAGQGDACYHYPLWQELREWIKDRRWEEGLSEKAMMRKLKRHPRYALWVKTEQKVLDEWEKRVRDRRVVGESAPREKARARADYIRRGGDTGAAEYQDTLKGRSKRRPLKRHVSG